MMNKRRPQYASLLSLVMVAGLTSPANAGYNQASPRMSISDSFVQALEPDLIQYIAAILNVSVSKAVWQKQVGLDQMKDLSQTGTLPEERKILEALKILNAGNNLRPFVMHALDKIKNWDKKALTGDTESNIDTVLITIEQTLALRGMTSTSQGLSYTEWPVLSQQITSKVENAPHDANSSLYFSQSQMSSADKAQILVDGSQSFPLRLSLMKGAKKSIDIMSWAVYADFTGYEAADILIQKQSEGVKVRLMVDGQTAELKGYNKAVKKMEKAGIEVIRWYNPKYGFEGQHRKMMIIDDEHIIAGGLNFGDVYSHQNPDPKVARWRDTDIYLHGPVVNDGIKIFADIWNKQNQDRHLNLQAMSVPAPDLQATGSIPVSLMTNDPIQNNQGSTVLLTLLKAIHEARSSVVIENAYVVLTPPLEKELREAIQRGVDVEILTNSDTSVDEPIVSTPISRSVAVLCAMGAKTYVKKGDTLHSKVAIIDHQKTMIMSYNLHPRSERVEGEMSTFIDNEEFATQAMDMFYRDIQPDKATLIQSPNDLKAKISISSFAILRIFFDML